MVHTWEAESRPRVPGTQSVTWTHTYLEVGPRRRLSYSGLREHCLDTLRWLHSSYWKEIRYRNRHGVGGVSSLSLVHSYTGVQLLRLEGREKDAGGSRNLKSRWVRQMWKLCPLSFLFQKETSSETELPCEARRQKESNCYTGNCPFSPHLSFLHTEPPSPQVEVTSGSNSPLFTRGLVIRGYED